MSDLVREEFEAWAITNAFLGLSESCMERHNEGYLGCELHAAWEAWQASPECLVVELPKPAGLDRMSSEMSMQEIREDNRFNSALELAKKALTAAGVKCK